LARLKAKTSNDLWMDDLDQFLTEFVKYETKEKEEESVSQLKAFKASVNQKLAYDIAASTPGVKVFLNDKRFDNAAMR
jgi:hypothetical protein